MIPQPAAIDYFIFSTHYFAFYLNLLLITASVTTHYYCCYIPIESLLPDTALILHILLITVAMSSLLPVAFMTVGYFVITAPLLEYVTAAKTTLFLHITTSLWSHYYLSLPVTTW